MAIYYVDIPESGRQYMHLANSSHSGAYTKWRNDQYLANGTYIVIDEPITADIDCADLFSGCLNQEIEHLDGIDFSDTESFVGMFDGCPNLKRVDASNGATGNVKTLTSMFRDCTNLEYVSVVGWDVSSVGKLTQMFQRCSKLRVIEASPNTDGPSQIDDSGYGEADDIFDGCESLILYDEDNGFGRANSSLGYYEEGYGGTLPGFFSGIPAWGDFDVYIKDGGAGNKADLKIKEGTGKDCKVSNKGSGG